MSAARTTLILADVSSEDGTRWEAVHLTGTDELVIEGHDLGPGVARFFGCSEYEFQRSLSTRETAVLRGLLSITTDSDLLATVGDRFGSVSDLETFLKKHDIEGVFWSRIGD